MDIFLFDSATSSLQINEYSVLLIKEFAALWDDSRNKCKEDKTGKKKLKAFKELTYIYLMLDFKSPYFQYTEGQKHMAALSDSGLTESDLKDEAFRNAYNKYLEMQESDPILSLIKTAYRTLFKTQVFLDNIDFNTDVDEYGRPLYKPKDIMADIASIRKIREDLQALEIAHKKDLASSGGKIRGDVEVGYDEM